MLESAIRAYLYPSVYIVNVVGVAGKAVFFNNLKNVVNSAYQFILMAD